MSNSLKALVFGERGELFAQVAHQKWETMRESLRSLTKNEQMSKLLVILSESLIRSFFRQKCAILRKPMSVFPALFSQKCKTLAGHCLQNKV